MSGLSSQSYSLHITGFFDPDFDPNVVPGQFPDIRDDVVEMREARSFYTIMGYTDGYVGNPSRSVSFSPPYCDYYQEGWNNGSWTRKVDTQN